MRKILFILFLTFMFFCGCSNGITTPEGVSKVIEVNSETWDKEVLQVKRLVMVDFYADWCKPCEQLTPIVEALAKENYPKLKVCKLDIDENRDIYVKYKIRGIPCLIFFEEGKDIDRIIGLKTKKYIQARIDSLLKKKKDNCEGGVCTPPK
jgi:thioredoxin 1